MAGLPYYFFPTDYLYPRTQTAAADIASKAALLPAGPVQSLKIARVDSSPKAVDGVRSGSSASASLVMSESEIQKELRRGTPVVADPRKSDDEDIDEV